MPHHFLILQYLSSVSSHWSCAPIILRVSPHSAMRRWVAICFFASTAAIGGVLAAGELLSYPAHRLVGPPPRELQASAVDFYTSAGGRVSGWILPGKPKRGAVLLLHGVRGDRREMVDRAKFLSKLGYGILLVDLPAHGESSGDRITTERSRQRGSRPRSRSSRTVSRASESVLSAFLLEPRHLSSRSQARRQVPWSLNRCFPRLKRPPTID